MWFIEAQKAAKKEEKWKNIFNDAQMSILFAFLACGKVVVREREREGASGGMQHFADEMDYGRDKTLLFFDGNGKMPQKALKNYLETFSLSLAVSLSFSLSLCVVA